MFGAYYFGQPFFGESPAYAAGATATRDNCGGAFGTATFGQSYFGGHIQCGEPPPVVPPSNPNCGGIFGSATFGQPYFGQHIQCGEPPAVVPPTRPNCGGMFGTATFGQPYFGGHYECNVFEPPPPVIPPVVVPVVPPPTGGGGPSDTRTRGPFLRDESSDLPTLRQRTAERWAESQIEADDEDIAFILSLWLSLK